VVTKHGHEVVVIVSADEYRPLKGPEDDLIAFLRSTPDFDLLDLRRAEDHAREPEL
jgi:PHD/YefM family antitoxin component YafN of YafNO toxin-antitoxin module